MLSLHPSWLAYIHKANVWGSFKHGRQYTFGPCDVLWRMTVLNRMHQC